MKFTTRTTSQPLSRTDLLVVLALQGKRLDLPAGVSLPRAATQDFKGEFRQMRFTDPTGGAARRVLLLGLGKRADLSTERVRRAAGMAVRRARAAKAGSATLWLAAAAESKIGDGAAGRAVAEGALMGAYRFTDCKSDAKADTLKSVAACGSGSGFRSGTRRGKALAGGNAFTRDLQNNPGNLMRPRDMVSAARKVARMSSQISVKAYNEKAMETMGMGSLLSVSRGSSEPAFMIHLTYKPKGRSKGRIAFVGKGLTFDAGGISIKPAGKMDEMRFDMSGGAAVLGAFHALASIGAPFEVHGIVPTSENLPDGMANKPGDIVTAMNGKTIEVLNTDAEGRLILADALAYVAKKIKPDTTVDLATLTGAVVVALGHELSGMITTSDSLAKDLTAAGEDSGELVWRLPLMDCHRNQMKGLNGDLKNINSGEGNGSTTGAAFLENFVGDEDWAHLDIAGSAWGGIDRDYVGGAKMGTGVGVRLLLQYLENRA